MAELTITELDPDLLDELEQLADERGVTVDEVILSLIDREVRYHRGRSIASLALLFGPIVVLVLLILFGD